ncbi:hypothetical protein K432DRAFT_380911 [Lepidopterella palustris CBS 459.81]|uniref:Uncharacterized protein n=1 Tax=Lepidopterella palustris CBS 459.81 TaxID=1314670 RepID=A0A8E2JGL1_9PEZI|nr:hypothetical protein K432DRAFT_380911 [Lepidopterella palustris CBS 459.81]
MPIARRRGLDNRVRYFVTRDDDVEVGDPEDSQGGSNTEGGSGNGDYGNDGGVPSWVSTPTITVAPSSKTLSNEAKQMSMVTSSSSPDASPIRVTITSTATASPFIEAKPPTETVIVTIPPPNPDHHPGGLSDTTEHLLIAAGSIGATIIVVMIIFAIYTMRKRGVTLAQTIKRTRKTKPQPQGPPPFKPRNWTTPAYTWDRNEPFDYRSKDLPITPPHPAMTRSGSNSSQRPLMLQMRNQSFPQQPSANRSTSPDDSNTRSFLFDSPPRSPPLSSHNRNSSNTPSSPVLPFQASRESASTSNTRSQLSSELQYPQPPFKSSGTPQPPPPTFRQFLFNRRYSNPSPKLSFDQMVSRFSWTNSQAPQTPKNATRASNLNLTGPLSGTTLARESVATSRSSVARFRTVDSWVDQQAQRVEEQRLREQLRVQGSVFISNDVDEEERVPEVPVLPKNVMNMRESEGTGAAAGNVTKQKRRETSTTLTSETATIFRQHPGTEVRMSTRSLVPSEILNSKKRLSVL